MTNNQKNKWKDSLSTKTLIMGILNATPDSFSDGGCYNQVDAAIKQATKMVKDGADIIDIGGESTRPGSKMVSQEEELKRVLPIVRAVADSTNVPISIDTYKACVARRAIEEGATIINDVWGAKADPEIANVAAEYKVPIVLMHNREKPIYKDLMVELVNDLYKSIEICLRSGVRQEDIVLDPGIGFGKTYEQNIKLMEELSSVVDMGFPVLLGTSRKSLIGLTLDLPTSERVEGTGATVCFGIMKGCHIMRVHDVLEMSRAANMMDVLVGKGVKVSG